MPLLKKTAEDTAKQLSLPSPWQSMFPEDFKIHRKTSSFEKIMTLS
jgi:hypothetical protein